MRVLVSSDWQAEVDSLPLCTTVVEEILSLKKKLGFEVFVHCGDLKQHYSPVDLRVINFGIKAISVLRREGLRVIICLGNHDRRSLYSHKESWFPVLRKAGAQACDDPTIVQLGNGFEIRVLPFRSDPILLRREAADLADGSSAETSALIFHADLRNCRYNVLSRSEASFSAKDLVPQKYLWCIGGHIHLQQSVGNNVYYVGSPCATDWGEANQRKGYLLLDFDARKLTSVPSKIPGWYDPEWPGFEEARPKTWKGTRVRIKVRCGGSDVKEALKKAKEDAERVYEGAELVVIPRFEENATGSLGIRAEWPDKKKIDSYVAKTLPEELVLYKEKVLAYLVSTLEQVGGLVREGGELRVQKIMARNFLPFERVTFEFRPGLWVVAGKNLDWNRSIGAGKTSFLQTLAVALFGRTFKDQKHDAWMRQDIGKTEQAWVKAWFEDAQGRQCEVKRGRRPKALRLLINGEGVESGNRPEDTQKLIEQVTGYTWETLSNAIYIDQTRAHLMLTGTEAERKGFLAKLQNLERFQRAEKVVREKKKDVEVELEGIRLKIAMVESEVTGLHSTMEEVKRLLAPKWDLDLRVKRFTVELKKAEANLTAWEEKAKAEIAMWEKERDHAVNDRLFRRAKNRQLLQAIEELAGEIETLKKLKDGKCSVCGQTITGEHVRNETAKMLVVLDKLRREVKPELTQEREWKVIAELTKWRGRNRELEREVAKAQEGLLETRTELKQLERNQVLMTELTNKIQRVGTKKLVFEEQARKKSRWLSVLEYAVRVFARDGLPAFLTAQTCPALNQAADKYAELFSDREIQVRFVVDEEGEMDVRVVNAHGGREVQDQSEGEMKIASLITSFAARTLAPKTNVLILDEPGHGLEDTSARQFARALRKLLSEFCIILMTTHNAAILSEVEDGNLVTIVKKGGVSRLEEKVAS